jgi:16S rRNA (guanine527-N7)-methyltransferase
MKSEIPTPAEMETLLAPMLLRPLATQAYEQFSTYLNLLYRWNQHMNLTAVRMPRHMAALHLGESARCAQLLPLEARTVLDFGSGAGLPGIPIQIVRPEMAVTLAESQIKKAAFLREIVRTLNLTQTTVYAGRANNLANCSTWNNSDTGFDMVTLRAVDRMAQALLDAVQCLRAGGWLAVLTSWSEAKKVQGVLPEIQWTKVDAIPTTKQRVLLLGQK